VVTIPVILSVLIPRVPVVVTPTNTTLSDLNSSPALNPETVVPIPTFVTLRTLVSESQLLTLASVLDN